jgi:hypothetical protein
VSTLADPGLTGRWRGRLSRSEGLLHAASSSASMGRMTDRVKVVRAEVRYWDPLRQKYRDRGSCGW